MGTDLLNIVWGIGLSIIPYFVLAFIPVWDQLRYSRKTALLLGLCCILLNIISVIVIIALFPNWNSLRFFHSVFFLLLYIAVYLCLVQGTPTKLIFIALLVKSYADFIVNMAKFMEVNFSVYLLHKVYVYSTYSFYFNLFQCLALLLTYPMIWIFFRKKITHVVQTNNRAWRFIWIVPLVYYIISLSFGAMDSALIAQWQFFVFNLVSFFGFYLIYYVVIEMLEQSEKNILLAEKNKIINQQLVLQENYYQKFGTCIEATRKSEHDLRHHLNTVKGLIQKKNNEKAKDYIDTLVDAQESLSDILYCKNDAINALVGYYANICRREDIDLTLAMAVPEELFIEDSDLCVVIGNLLENAVEASRKVEGAPRSISASAQLVKNRFYIAVDNRFSGELKMKYGEYLSSKRKNEAGIGLSSVLAIARKYAGQATFKTEAQTFYASVMMAAKSD